LSLEFGYEVIGANIRVLDARVIDLVCMLRCPSGLLRKYGAVFDEARSDPLLGYAQKG
jgi:hypothetical protein